MPFAGVCGSKVSSNALSRVSIKRQATLRCHFLSKLFRVFDVSYILFSHVPPLVGQVRMQYTSTITPSTAPDLVLYAVPLFWEECLHLITSNDRADRSETDTYFIEEST